MNNDSSLTNQTNTYQANSLSRSLIKPLRIGVVAGEESGDLLGASLMQEINALHPKVEWVGVGGKAMQAVGMKNLFPMQRLAVMGLVEVLKHLPDLLKAKEELITFFEHEQIDMFIGIDAPDFNLRVAKVLKNDGLHTVQYVSPSVWAWREKRIHNIMAATNQVLCLFPFELPVYQKYKHPAVCVGHPMMQTIKKPRDMLATRRDLVWTLAPLKERFIERDISSVVGLLPGSRHGEVARIAPVLFDTAKVMLEKEPTLVFMVPAVSHEQKQQLDQLLAKCDTTVQDAVIVVIDSLKDNFSHEVMAACDMLVLASGTVTLEAMLLAKPMVVVYKLNNMTYKIAKKMVKIPSYSLPNIIARKKVVPELIQEDATPEKIAIYALDLLNEEKAEEQINQLLILSDKLRNEQSESAAVAVLAGFF